MKRCFNDCRPARSLSPGNQLGCRVVPPARRAQCYNGDHRRSESSLVRVGSACCKLELPCGRAHCDGHQWTRKAPAGPLTVTAWSRCSGHCPMPGGDVAQWRQLEAPGFVVPQARGTVVLRPEARAADRDSDSPAEVLLVGSAFNLKFKSRLLPPGQM
jgi:hypothetical protein